VHQAGRARRDPEESHIVTISTTAPRELRDYQVDAADAVESTWDAGTARTAVVLPTGSGKSTVIAELATRAARRGQRVVMLAHRGELLAQMSDAVAAVDPSAAPVGIVRAEVDESDAQIIAASLQTLTNGNRLAAIGPRDLVLWDEVHHVAAQTWHEVLVGLGGYEPGAKMCGFTATLRRDDGKVLRSSIERVAYERDLRWAIREGHLVPPTGLTVKVPDLDLASIRTTAGDFNQGQLAEVMEAATASVVDAVVRFAPDRRPIIFASSVLAAQMISDALNAAGYPASYVTGDMSLEQRQPVYEAYRRGLIRALVTVMVLTEGADFPMCDAAVIARPTQSQVLYSQMVGRSLRLYEGKSDALVLDLVGTTRVLKLVTLTDLGAGVVPKIVDPEGNEIAPEDDEESAEVAAPRVRTKREGPLDMVEIDLLSDASELWLSTNQGVPFFEVEGLLIFLWPEQTVQGEAFRAGWLTAKGQRRGGWIEDEAYDVGTARNIAVDFVLDHDRALPRRNASWRRSQPPSEKQLAFARGLGIPTDIEMSKARLSDEIGCLLASRRLHG
jgi:superfamily II DNA or RNA helicase